MAERGCGIGIAVLVRKQVIVLFFAPPYHILHRVEGNQPFGEYRKVERSLQDCREQTQIPFAKCLCRCTVGICPAEAEKIHIRLQMVGGDGFQLSAADRVLFDTIDRSLIRHYRTVAEIAGL